MSKLIQRRLVISLLLMDALAVALALAIAYWLRIVSGWLPDRSFEEFAVYARVSALIVPMWLVIFWFHNLYDVRTTLGGLEEYTQIAKACLVAIVAVIMLGYWVRIAVLSRGWLILAWVFGVLFAGGFRFAYRRVIYWLRRRGRLRTRTLIVGANEQGKAIARQFLASESAGVDVVGFIDDFLPAGAPVRLDDWGDLGQAAGELRVLGSPDRLHDVASDQQVSQVVVVSNAVAWETFQEIMQAASLSGQSLPYEIKLSPGFYEILTTGVQVTHEAFVPLLLVNRQRITGVDALLKGLLDYGLGMVNVVLTLPLMALIGLALRIVAGAVLERHEVLACGGGTFTTWKFRTGLSHTPRPLFGHPLSQAFMLPGAQPGGAGAGSLAFSRPAAAAGKITWLHRFLYNTGLDKLPQMFNILRGEMSWVGPRTVNVGQTEMHSPWLPNLLTVKPGITGPWAVGGNRSLDDEMRLTMIYIRNWTIWLDLQILLQTAQRIFRLERAKARLPEQ